MSSAIVNGQRQPRIFALLGYVALAIILATSTAGEGYDEEAKKGREGAKIVVMEDRGLVYSLFRQYNS